MLNIRDETNDIVGDFLHAQQHTKACDTRDLTKVATQAQQYAEDDQWQAIRNDTDRQFLRLLSMKETVETGL